jgi:hypothetical protein
MQQQLVMELEILQMQHHLLVLVAFLQEPQTVVVMDVFMDVQMMVLILISQVDHLGMLELQLTIMHHH